MVMAEIPSVRGIDLQEILRLTMEGGCMARNEDALQGLSLAHSC